MKGPVELECYPNLWAQDLQRFAAFAKRDTDEVLTDQARLFLRDLAKTTAPMVNFNAPGESYAAQRRAGLAATKNDIERVFTPLEDLVVIKNAQDPKFAARMKGYIQSGRIDYLQTVIPLLEPSIRPEDITDSNEKLRAVHLSQRDKRGRVRRRPHRFFVPKALLQSYVKQRQRWVGLLKAGWGVAAARLKVALPQWVSSQPSSGRIAMVFGDEASYIRLTNSVRYADDKRGQDTVRECFKRRSQAMRRQIEAKLRGAWDKGQRRFAA